MYRSESLWQKQTSEAGFEGLQSSEHLMTPFEELTRVRGGDRVGGGRGVAFDHPESLQPSPHTRDEDAAASKLHLPLRRDRLSAEEAQPRHECFVESCVESCVESRRRGGASAIDGLGGDGLGEGRRGVVASTCRGARGSG